MPKPIYGLDHVADFLEMLAEGLRKGQIRSVNLSVDDDGTATAQVRLLKPSSRIAAEVSLQYAGRGQHRLKAHPEDDESWDEERPSMPLPAPFDDGDVVASTPPPDLKKNPYDR